MWYFGDEPYDHDHEEEEEEQRVDHEEEEPRHAPSLSSSSSRASDGPTGTITSGSPRGEDAACTQEGASSPALEEGATLAASGGTTTTSPRGLGLAFAEQRGRDRDTIVEFLRTHKCYDLMPGREHAHMHHPHLEETDKGPLAGASEWQDRGVGHGTAREGGFHCPH